MADPDNKKKKNSKSMPLGINIGCNLGIGGIVLLGGGLVTAALVSALARRQHRSSSNAAINNKNQLDLELMSNELNQDFGLQNSSDEATAMELHPKPNQILTPDENQNSGVDREEKVDSADGISSVVGEDQESSLIYIDSVFETEQVDNGYEKIMLDCEQQLVVASQTELGFPLSEKDSCCAITAPRDGGGEEQKYPMLIHDSDTDAAGTEKSLDSIEAAMLMEEYEAVEVEEIPNGHVVEDQETVLTNDQEAASLEKKVKDGHDEMISENCEGDLIDETGYPDSVVSELVMIEEAKIEVEDNPQVQFLEEDKEIDGHDEIMVEDCEGDSSYETGEILRREEQQMENNSEQATGEEEEAIKAACVEPVKMEDNAQEMQLNQVRETSFNREHPSLAVDGTAVTQGKDTAQEVEKVTTNDEFVNEQEKDKEGEMPHVQLIEVDDQPVVREDNPPRQLMTAKDELVKKEGKSNEDEIPHVTSAKNGEEDASEVSSDGTRYSSMQEEVIPEAKISNHNTEENMSIVGEDQNDSDYKIRKEGKTASNYRERFTKQAAASEPWILKLWPWSLLASIWCICHCYSELPFPELSFVCSLLFIFILLGYQKRTKYSVKYE